MIRTRACDLLGIDHPIVLGGMGSGTSAPLVAAVSNAGGFGTLGAANLSPTQLGEQIAAIQEQTERVFGINFLLFEIQEESFAVALEARPPLIAFAWARPEQDLRTWFDRVHDIGSKVMFMAGEVDEAVRGAKAGAEVIVAQGTEGGGHVGWMASMPLVPMVVSAVAPLPVLAAGGIADGRGLAAALALGAEGVLLGTRFLATDESPLHANHKDAIARSDGHNTVLTEIPDIVSGRVWPGAMARAARNGFIRKWAGREWNLRRRSREAGKEAMAARQAGDVENASLLYGQDAGLIEEVLPAAEVIRRTVEEAEAIISSRLGSMIQ